MIVMLCHDFLVDGAGAMNADKAQGLFLRRNPRDRARENVSRIPNNTNTRVAILVNLFTLALPANLPIELFELASSLVFRDYPNPWH